MAYIVGIGVLDNLGNEIQDYSAKDVYNDKDEAKDAYNKLTDDYVYNFLAKDLGFEETDIGYYKNSKGGINQLISVDGISKNTSKGESYAI